MTVKIGQICLDRLPEDDFQRFVLLLQAIGRHGIEQYAVVHDSDLARRLEVCEGVTVGYVVRSPMLAYCLMPTVSVAHVHGDRSGEAGLLLTLTRSIPYVITRHRLSRKPSRPILRSICRRAAGIICQSDEEVLLTLEFEPASQIDVISPIARNSRDLLEAGGHRAAADHLRVYHRVAENWQMPMLRV